MQTTVYSDAGGEIVEREILTPEGVPLHFGLARAGDRAGAFLLDALILIAGLVALTVPIVCSGLVTHWFGFSVLILAWFAGMSFYWAWFEIRWQGATPGKRMLNLRVIDRRGGLLTANAIFGRNLMRWIEFWIPLTVLLSPQALVSGGPWWAGLASISWLLVLGFLPLFNRDRLRAGDLVAGTMVVYAPRHRLLGDLSRDADKTDVERFTFTAEQLDHYGIRELQVLEDILRDPSTTRETYELVLKKILKKIDWPRDDRRRLPAEDFLRDFYDAQRGRLEGKLLMGERRERKTESRRKPPASQDPRRRRPR